MDRAAFGVLDQAAFGVLDQAAFGVLDQAAFGLLDRVAFGVSYRAAYGVFYRAAYGHFDYDAGELGGEPGKLREMLTRQPGGSGTVLPDGLGGIHLSTKDQSESIVHGALQTKSLRSESD